MSYSVQTWSDNDATKPVSAARMNYIEAGIAAVANGGSLPVKGSRVWAIGDSITAHGYTAIGSMPYAQLGSQAYLVWASLLSQGRIFFGGIAATSGYTAEQILATHVPTVVAASPKPAACIVLAGTNNISVTGSVSSFATTMTAIYTQLLAAGILPIACTLPPRSGDSAANIKLLTQFNAWITRYAQLNGLPLVDFYSQLVDPATGNWQAGLNLDNYHPNGAGAKIMGELISDVLCGTSYLTIRAGGPWLPPVDPWLPTNNVDTANLLTNGLMLTDSGAPAGRPTGWSLTAGTPGAESLGTDATVFGDYYSLTGAASNPTLTNNAASSTAVAGDLIYASCRIGLTVEATASLGYFRIGSASGSQDFFSLYAWDKDIPAGSVFAYEFTMPATANTRVQMSVKVATAAGVLKIGQLAALNLTAAGIS